MNLFDGVDLKKLTLRQMHFHIVGPPKVKGAEPVLEILGEVEHKGFEEFFLARVRESAKGNRFRFDPKSPTLALLRRLQKKEQKISSVAEDLARRFSKEHTMQMSAGVFMLFDIAHQDTTYHAIMKFDDQEVLAYRKEKSRTILHRLEKTFVQDERAMQKVAIARMKKKGEVELLVLERSNRRLGTEYFKRFLDVTRVWTDTELTQRFEEAVSKTVTEVRRELPAGQVNMALSRARQYMLDGEGLDENKLDEFRRVVFGPDENGIIERAFNQNLTSLGVDGEAFDFDKEIVTKPRTRSIVTEERIVVKYTEDQEGLIDRSNPKRIVITTTGIKSVDDETA